jgi:hypothetical protein
LRPAWERISWSRPDADIDQFSIAVRLGDGVIRPHVITATDEAGELEGILVTRLQQLELPAAFGYKVLYRPRLRVLVVAHGGITAPGGRAALLQLLRELDRALARGEADAVWFPSLPLGTPEFDAANGLGSAFRRERFGETREHRRLVLPESFEVFLASRSRKIRSGVRYAAKRLEERFGDELRIENLHDGGDVDRIALDLEAIASKTYQRGLGAGFSDSSERRALIELGLRRGWLRAYALYHSDRPIAFWHGWAYRRTYFSSSTGYDPAWSEHRVGIYLLMHVIADLCADPQVDVLDYGFGDATYKRQYGTDSFAERDVLVFAPSLRGVRVNLFRSAIVGSSAAAKRALAATGLTDRVKTGWRRRLRPGESEAEQRNSAN